MLGMIWEYEDFEQPLSVGVAISGDKTMVVSMYGTEYALVDTKTGENIWHKVLEDVEQANENIFQPVDAGRKMIFTAGNQLCCFDMEDGTQLWNFGAQETPIGPPTFYEPAVSNGRIYIGSNTGSLYCLDAPSGVHNWQITSKEDAYGPTIALNNKVATLMLSTRIECRRQDQGWLVWKNDHFKMPLEPIPNDGKILYLSSPGPSIAALDPDDMKVLWETSLDKKSGMLAISPSVDDKYVYCCDENKIYTFDKTDGKLS
ncbi:MAG: PQQ-binding-like beta-propeller repeat protein, partial [Caldiserica bacterium]|nr:PQQ-binding-like beta-propeller repeat protein [Caldisericota bacterium]